MQDTRHNLHYTTGDDVRARPAGILHDIPISTFDIDVPVYNPDIGNSLPTADEIRRLERPRPRRSMPWTKWTFSIAIAFACLLGIVVGIRRKAPVATETNRSVGGAADTAGTRSERDVIEYLLHYKVSSQESLKDHQSPQYKAVQWMVNTDRNPWTIPTVPYSQREGYMFASRYVMAVLYFALNAQNSWYYNLNFLSDDDICEWHQTVLDEQQGNLSPEFGVACDTFNIFPISLYMTNNNVRGSLPTELGVLFTLRTLDLEQNRLTGSLPTEVCELDQLHHLMLGKNFLTGSIPDCLHQLDGLQDLSLNDNVMEGPIPLSDNDLLRLLFLDDNGFSENPLPVLNQLSHLEFFMGQNNDFTGTLVEDTFSNHEKLAWVDLSGNGFESQENVAFPINLLKLPLLEVIDLSANSLNGALPDNFPLNERLKFLGLRANSIEGSVPTTITNLVSLHHLDLSENKLTGDIDILGELLSLRALYIGDNPLLEEAEIPETFQFLYNLRDLSLRESNRFGPIPNFLADLRNLELLDLGQNDLNETIPEILGELRVLEFLMLNKNPRLTGDLPATMDNLKRMRGVFLDGTNITGNVQEVICELPNFKLMDGKEIAYGDCFNGLYECACCTCCDPADTSCSSQPFQLNLRESWTKDFSKLNFEYTNETAFLERGEINAAEYSKPQQNGK